MASASSRPKLIVIVGPTASGKSDLAIKVAKKFNGEIICADSRTIYRGMNIGTAKPSTTDQKAVKHWGLDLVEPGQKFSAADFKKYAESKIEDIQNRGKLPILVGGTGLYVDAVLFDFSFVKPKKPPLHHRLFFPWWSIERLQKMISQRDWPLPENHLNRRHLLATIKRQGQAGSRKSQPRKDAIIIGLLPLDDVLKTRIDARAETIFEKGIIEETRELVQEYGQKSFAGTAGIAYTVVAQLLKGKLNNRQAIELIANAEWQYARRQKTWFKRNRYIKWFSSPQQAFEFVQKELLNT